MFHNPFQCSTCFPPCPDQCHALLLCRAKWRMSFLSFFSEKSLLFEVLWIMDISALEAVCACVNIEWFLLPSLPSFTTKDKVGQLSLHCQRNALNLKCRNIIHALPWLETWFAYFRGSGDRFSKVRLLFLACVYCFSSNESGRRQSFRTPAVPFQFYHNFIVFVHYNGAHYWAPTPHTAFLNQSYAFRSVVGKVYKCALLRDGFRCERNRIVFPNLVSQQVAVISPPPLP